ncbi:endolytic transglycosylase MltG [Staphylospora marina]|uniref:endolytic transglycosylase MltG n=1 Tax=Staphylospora marina TaxID=2490858 RepID=UPI000F5C092A|nr:endolytic transglycosylase MltG [Staphylospora marina]
MRWFWRIFFTLVLLAGWALLGYFYVDFTLGSPKRTQPVEVEIPENSSIQQIGKILKEKRLIRESYFFRYYVQMKGKTDLRAGYYEILPDESLDDILAKLSSGDENTVKVVIPEGKNARQIAEILEKAGFDKAGFLDMLNNKKPKYNFETEIPKHPERPYRLEGYLFPSTYYFRKDETPENIVNKMLEEFAKRMENLEVRDKLANNKVPGGMTVDKWVTIASLVEREGQVKAEFPKIAGVIYNRLNSNQYPKLQIDATIVYIYSMKGQKVMPTQKMTKLEHPYNTYHIKGLPPGPIGCPGEDALKAALEPTKHNYYFYVTKEDGSGEHYFASDYQQHQKYINMSRENRSKRQASGD